MLNLKPLAAIYCRISQDREGQEFGVQNQQDACRQLADAHGLTVVDVYIDNDRGASTRSKKSRPEYERLIADARVGKFKTVIAYSMSRLTRRPKEWEDLIQMHESHGIDYLYKVSPRYDLATADGRATARTVSAWDAAEAERIGERVSLRQAQKLANREEVGGARPFGWDTDRRTQRPAEAELIRLGAKMILDGATIYAVAKAWTETGLLPDRSKYPRWRSQTVRHILLSPRAVGRMVVKGVDYGQVADPIVDPADAEKVRAILLDPARKTRRGPLARACTAQRLMTCSVCGGYIAAAVTNGAPAVKCGEPYLLQPASHPQVKTEKLEEQLCEIALWGIMTKEPGELGASPDIAGAQMKVSAAKRDLERVTAAYVAGIGDIDYLGRESARLKAELEIAQVALDTILARTDTAGALELARRYIETIDGDVQVSSMRTALDPWRDYWYGLDVDARRRLMRGLFRSLKLLPYDRADDGRVEVDGVRYLFGRSNARAEAATAIREVF